MNQRLAQVSFVALGVVAAASLFPFIITWTALSSVGGGSRLTLNGHPISQATAVHDLWIGYGLLYASIAVGLFLTEKLRRQEPTLLIASLAGLSGVLLWATKTGWLIIGMIMHPSIVIMRFTSQSANATVSNGMWLFYSLVISICLGTIIVTCAIVLFIKSGRREDNQARS